MSSCPRLSGRRQGARHPFGLCTQSRIHMNLNNSVTCLYFYNKRAIVRRTCSHSLSLSLSLSPSPFLSCSSLGMRQVRRYQEDGKGTHLHQYSRQPRLGREQCLQASKSCHCRFPHPFTHRCPSAASAKRCCRKDHHTWSLQYEGAASMRKLALQGSGACS